MTRPPSTPPATLLLISAFAIALSSAANADTPISVESTLTLTTAIVQARVRADTARATPRSVPTLRSWAVSLTPFRGIGIWAGSITAAGLASRVKNPVSPTTSPRATRIVPFRRSFFLKGDSLETRDTGFEIGILNRGKNDGAQARIAAFARQTDGQEGPYWMAASAILPPLGPDRTVLAVTTFAGASRLKGYSADSWYTPRQCSNPSWLYFPAADITLSGERVQGELTAYANLGPMKRPRGGLTAQSGLFLSPIRLNASWSRFDLDFIDFSGAYDPIREQLKISPSLSFRIPSSRRPLCSINGTWGVERLSSERFSVEPRHRRYQGLELTVDSAGYAVGVGLERDDEVGEASAKLTLPRFPIRSCALILSYKGSFKPELGIQQGFETTMTESTLSWAPSARLTFRFKSSMSRSCDTASPTFGWKASCQAIPIKSRHASSAVSISAENLEGRLSGAVSLTLSLR